MRDVDLVAIYAAPVEAQGIEAQAALGAGSVTDDLLSGRGDLASRDALDDAVGGLEPGIYDLTARFTIGDSDARTRTGRTEVRSLVIGSEDTPADRAARVTRALQSLSRDIVKENSKLLVRLAGAVLSPEGVLGETPKVDEPIREPEPEPIKRRPRRKPAKKRPRRKAAKKPTRKAPAKKPTRKAPAKKPTRKAPAKKPTRKAPAKKPTRKAPAKRPTRKAPAKKPTRKAPAKKPTRKAPAKKPTKAAKLQAQVRKLQAQVRKLKRRKGRK